MHGDHFILMKNTETIDAYVNYIRQVATLLGYQEPQVLDVFKNTFLTTLYWVLFSHSRFEISSRNSKKDTN